MSAVARAESGSRAPESKAKSGGTPQKSQKERQEEEEKEKKQQLQNQTDVSKRVQNAGEKAGDKLVDLASQGKPSDKALMEDIKKLEGKTATEMLVYDHRKVDKLFKECLDLPKGDKQKAEIVKKIIEELSIHANIEEKVYYPAVYKASPGMVLESVEEHHFVKVGLQELQDMTPDHPRYDAKVHVVKEMVEHHVEEEETKLFKDVEKALTKQQLIDIGKELLEAKKTAGREPKPEETMENEEEIAEEEERQEEEQEKEDDKEAPAKKKAKTDKGSKDKA